MHSSVITFLSKNVTVEDIKGKRVLEVGSYDVNGTPRPTLSKLGPSSYIGMDASPGPSVDVAANAELLSLIFGEASFDVVISTEMLEHVKDWKKIIVELKRVLKPSGLLLLTTRSFGFPYHGYPGDFWRYSIEDFQKIFSDMETLFLGTDPEAPGVFYKGRKPDPFIESDLSTFEVYAMPQPR